MSGQLNWSEFEGAEFYESHSLLFMNPFADALIERVKVGANETLLDVACGTGVVARRSGAKATGIDFNETMLQAAESLAPDIIWVHGSADDLPFERSTFDAVTCQQGLQFFPDPEKAVREMHRVLREGGKAALSIWAPLPMNPYFEAQSEAIETYLETGAVEGIRMAVREDAAEFLEKTIANVGFSRFEVEGVEAVVNLPEIGSYVADQIHATPRGPVYDAADSEAQEAFQAHLRANLGQYAQEDGTYGIPFASYVVTATK